MSESMASTINKCTLKRFNKRRLIANPTIIRRTPANDYRKTGPKTYRHSHGSLSSLRGKAESSNRVDQRVGGSGRQSRKAIWVTFSFKITVL